LDFHELLITGTLTNSNDVYQGFFNSVLGTRFGP